MPQFFMTILPHVSIASQVTVTFVPHFTITTQINQDILTFQTNTPIFINMYILYFESVPLGP